MPESLAPKLKKISVKYTQLILDPNNPRFITRTEHRVPEEEYLALDLSGSTRDRLMTVNDKFRIEELKRSIAENSWLPVDNIFVRKYKPDEKYYVVLEGNRRVTAIRALMNDPETTDKVKKAIQSLEVMEVLDSGTPEELQKKITYLLGVRHHGSLVKWTPFARARNIMERYCEITGQTTETFKWDINSGRAVANALSIPLEEVQDRLKVYRVMEQVGSLPEVKEGVANGGGMKDRYYSVCEEPLANPRKELKKYIEQNPETFLLADESASRMANLCEFNTPPPRKNAPINTPFEWRQLEKILTDPDTVKKEANLQLVEVQKQRPSVVWAARAAELYKPTWDKWLLKVNTILKTVSLADDFSSKQAKETTKRLVALVDKLDAMDAHK